MSKESQEVALDNFMRTCWKITNVRDTNTTNCQAENSVGCHVLHRCRESAAERCFLRESRHSGLMRFVLKLKFLMASGGEIRCNLHKTITSLHYTADDLHDIGVLCPSAVSDTTLVFPQSTVQIRKGLLINTKGHACRVAEVFTSETGKHGHNEVGIGA